MSQLHPHSTRWGGRREPEPLSCGKELLCSGICPSRSPTHFHRLLLTQGGDGRDVPRKAAEVGAGQGWQPSPRCLLDVCAAELGERQFQEACFEALTSKKRKRLLNKR